jgi:DNA-binding transcriptional regulator GbsR (MarR family)
MIEAGGRTAQSFGLNRLIGQIYMFLYLSKEPQTLDQLAAELGVSKASISIACRQLESWGAARTIWRKGDRKDYYVAETDFSRIIGGGLMASVSKKLESARVQIERSLKLLEEQGGQDGVDRDFLMERLRDAEAKRAKIASLIDNPLVRKFL